ncbi:tetratricopeptide repeat protein [Micromonospora sp. NPDC049101]|uniref:tetratricopeptide repeat protein n=1 Tax=Micromonospora sp. NPDC049101 TaxID=3155032 RepID=UPI0033E69255
MGFSDDVRAAFRRGETAAVVRMSEVEIDRARAAGDPAGEVEARYSLARVAIRGGDLAGGEARAREALAVAVAAGDRSLEERPRHVLAAVARMSGDLARARELYRESIALNEALGQPEVVNSETHNLAFCELGLGNLDAARALFAASREKVFRNGWADFVPYVCVAGAALASAHGDHARAARMIAVTDAAFAALGQVPDPDDAADLAAVRAAAVEALGPAGYAQEYARGQRLEPQAAFADGDDSGG